MKTRYAAWVCSLLIIVGLANTGLSQDEPAEDPTIVTSKLEKLDLVVQLRPILSEITTADSLRVALHFEKSTGPVDYSDETLGAQRYDRKAFVEGLEIAIMEPGGDWQIIKPEAGAEGASRLTSFATEGTTLLELAPKAIHSLRVSGQQEFSTPWSWDSELKPGDYKIAFRGVLNLSSPERTIRIKDEAPKKVPATETEITFKTKPIKIHVERADMKNQSLAELGEGAIEAVQGHPEIAADNLTVKGVESIAIADAEGNRIIRVRADLPPLPPGAPRIGGGRGYWQYEVAMSTSGEVGAITRWRKGFCIARGTTISTPNGSIAIEDLYAGAAVWAYDLKQESLVAVNVLAIESSRTDDTLVINGRLRLTPEHPVCVVAGDKSVWKVAADVRMNDLLIDQAGRRVRVESIEANAEAVDVYDVAVSEPNNFFAGGLLVHNKSIAWTAKAFVPWYALWNRAPVRQ